MVFFHTHKGSVLVGFGIIVALAQDGFFLFVFSQFSWSVLFCIVQFLLYLFAFFSAFQGSFYPFYDVAYLFGINGSKVGGLLAEIFFADLLCILPKFFQLAGHLFLVRLDGFAPNKGIFIGVCLYFGAIGINFF